MARAQRAAMALRMRRFTAPCRSDRLMPFARSNAGIGTAAAGIRTAGYGRDPLAPTGDRPFTGSGGPYRCGSVRVSLKAAFGQPVSGTTPKTHTFQSGNWTLPSMAIGNGDARSAAFRHVFRLRAGSVDVADATSASLTATARLVAQGETIAPPRLLEHRLALGLQRFGHFNGTVKCNGSALGNVVSAEITYSNNLDRIRYQDLIHYLSY